MSRSSAFYDRLVDEAADQAATTGVVDLVSLAQAGEAGFGMAAFTNDVLRRVDDPDRLLD